jgi:hypothetical protein
LFFFLYPTIFILCKKVKTKQKIKIFDKMLSRRWLGVIIIPIAIALILYFVIFPLIEWHVGNKFVGTWESSVDNVTITFYQNNTFEAYNNGSHYEGNWKITNILSQSVNLNWEGFYTDYNGMFGNDNNELRLLGVDVPAGQVMLYKK